MSERDCLTTLKENFNYVQELIKEIKLKKYDVDKIRDLERLFRMQCDLSNQIKRLEE